MLPLSQKSLGKKNILSKLHNLITWLLSFLLFIATILCFSHIVQPTANVPRMVNTTEGAISIITCTATGVPLPTISWIRPDNSSLVGSRYAITDPGPTVVVTDGSNEVFQITSNFTVMNATRGDTGVYSCMVYNVVNSLRSDTTLTVMCKLI